MRGATARLLATFAVILLYVGVLWNEGFHSNHEVLPFFKWELFSRVPDRMNSSYSARILEIDGEVLEEPLYFEEARDHLRNARSPEAQLVLQRFGQALERDEIIRAGNQRELFEDRWLEAERVRYVMVRRDYDLLERISCRCYVSEKVIGVFVSD